MRWRQVVTLEQLRSLTPADVDALSGLTIAQRDAVQRALHPPRISAHASPRTSAHASPRTPEADVEVPNFRRPLCKSYLGNRSGRVQGGGIAVLTCPQLSQRNQVPFSPFSPV